MGLLVEGVWKDEWYDTTSTGGEFERTGAQFREWIKADGSTPFTPEVDRYHLYISMACPWAHRTLIFRKLKRLEALISVSLVDPFMGSEGWFFGDHPDCTPDAINHTTYLRDIYTMVNPTYTGRVTVPILWDKKLKTIVNNESSEIIRMFNSAFDQLTGSTLDFYPQQLHTEIHAINEEIYEHVNNGVYRAGFSTTQVAYEKAFDALFGTLDKIEELLSRQPFLCGEQLTEADWRLFPTLIRFDAVYYSHFKCNRQRIEDYEHLSNYTRALYQLPGIAETFDLAQTKGHYYGSHDSINPTRLIPKGPRLDFHAPHNRGRIEL